MTSEQLESLHAAVFRNTGHNSMWLGYWIKHFVESEGMTWPEAAQEMGISSDHLVLLCLCRTPRADHFQEDLRVVCERTGAKEEVVARIIRQEQAMIHWQKNTSSVATGWLLAASDCQEPSDADQGAEVDEDEN